MILREVENGIIKIIIVVESSLNGGYAAGRGMGCGYKGI